MQFYTGQQAAFRLSPNSSAYVSQSAMTGKSRDLPTAIALAMVLCSLTPLPAGETHSAEEYFIQNAGVYAGEAANALNELMPVDFRTALELAKSLYLVRYELANKPFCAFGYDRKDGLSSIFGLTAHVSLDILECMKTNAQEITDKFERIKTIVGELKKD